MPVPIPYTASAEPVIVSVPFDGLNFKTVTWNVPLGVTHKGTIVYVHGFAEHSEIYTEFFDKLSRQGYEIFFFDQRGAGETSPGKLIGRTDEYHTFRDLDFMIKKVLDARQDKTEKLYLGGHSMGGGIVLNYAISGTHRNELRGVFACAPLVTLHPKSQPNIVLRGLQPVINKLIPTLKIDSQLNYDYITSNEGWKKYIEGGDTKLIGTVRQYNDMFVRGKKLLDKQYVNGFVRTVPLLTLHGTLDYINDLEGTKKFVALLPADVNLELYSVKDGRHSLFIENETIFADVFAKLLDFLNSH